MSKIAWEEFLDPDVVRLRLLAASVYIASFEFLKERLVDRLKSFLATPGADFESRYKDEVLSRNSSPVHASLDWLEEAGAISEDDIDTFERVKQCRNKLAHELLGLIASEGLPETLPDRYDELIRVFRKVETWWIVEVETVVNPQFDGKEIDPEKVLPGPIAGLAVLRDIALGEEKESRYYYDHLFGEGLKNEP